MITRLLCWLRCHDWIIYNYETPTTDLQLACTACGKVVDVP